MAGLVSSTVLFSGCNKKKDTIAKIYVLDSSNNPVSACTVTLEGISSEGRQADVNVDMTTETNASGEAIFNFNDLYKKGQAGMAVLNIKAKKGVKEGNGIIKVEEEKTNEKTIFLLP